MLKRTKWAGYVFSEKQKSARAKWRRAQENVTDINNALRMYPKPIDWFLNTDNHAELHRRLDERLNTIVTTAKSAQQLFPEVDESFTVSTGKI